MIICVNVIPAKNVSVKLDMHFIHWPTREIQTHFRSCMANFKRKFKLLFHKLSSSLKYIKVRMTLLLFNLDLILLGKSSERPRALQLLIKMLN